MGTVILLVTLVSHNVGCTDMVAASVTLLVIQFELLYNTIIKVNFKGARFAVVEMYI